MANVSIKFNGKEFLLSCEDGQEEHLEELLIQINQKFNNLKNDLGNLGENKLLLITAIKVMDEYHETKKKVEQKKEELNNLSSKFKELKSLIYEYRDKKEGEINKLSEDHFKLKNESHSPFHAYLLLSDSSKYVLDQSVQFASTISLSENNDQEHPDIRVIESENINTIGIEDVRDILNRDNLSPIVGKYKVIIFPPYKSLTEEASNALLKTLEEPSSSSIFIITSTGNFWSHAKDDANTGIINTIKSRCRTVFVESETATNYDFTFDDFSNFVDIRDFISKVDRDKVDSLLKILEKLIKIESTSSKNMYKFQALLKSVKNIQSEFEETTATFKNKLTTRSLEYVVRAVLTSNHIDKLNYRYCELIQRAIEEIQQGMRDSIVLNNLSVELGEL